MKTKLPPSPKEKFSGLEGKTFDEIEEIAKSDRTAVFHGGKSWIGRDVPITDEIKERHALAYEVEEKDYKEISTGLLNSLENGAIDRISSRVRERIQKAAEALKRRRSQSGSNYFFEGAPFFTEVDPLKTATTLFDGGSFYEGALYLPGVKLPIRIKKYGDPVKFKRGLPIQRFLRRLERDGIIPQKINEPAYIDEKNGLVAELHLEGKRLLDVLRTAGSDQDKAKLIEPVIKDYVEMSVRAHEYRDLKVDQRDMKKMRRMGLEDIADEDIFYLKKQGGIITSLRNKLPGNYIVPTQGGSVDNFLKVYALRAVPHLRNVLLNKKGSIDESGFSKLGGLGSVVSNLREGIGQFVGKDFDSRPRYIVNLDANTSQVIMMPDGRRVYSDWDHTYFGLIEEQLAEMLLTSSIQDESVQNQLVHAAHARLIELQPTKSFGQCDAEDFKRVVDKKMVEKLLGRAARFMDAARGVEDTKERKNLDDLADRAYTKALRKMDTLAEEAEREGATETPRKNWTLFGGIATSSQIRYAQHAIRTFNEHFLHLQEVEGDEGLDEFSDSIGSIISTVQDRVPLEGLKSNYRISAKPVDWKGIGSKLKTIAWVTPVLAGITWGGFRGYYNGKAEEMKTAAMYSGKEIYLVDPVTGENLVLSGDGKMEDLPKKNLKEVVGWAYEVNPKLENKDFIIDSIINKDLSVIRNTIEDTRKMYAGKYEEFIQSTAKSMHLDPDLIKAVIYSVGREFDDVRGRAGPMKIKPYSKYFKDRGHDEISQLDINPHENIRAGSEYLYQCVRHNGGRLADTLAEYFNGVYNTQRAMIERGSQDYSVYRGAFKDLGVIEHTDSAIAAYLHFKGVGKESADTTKR